MLCVRKCPHGNFGARRLARPRGAHAGAGERGEGEGRRGGGMGRYEQGGSVG